MVYKFEVNMKDALFKASLLTIFFFLKGVDQIVDLNVNWTMDGIFDAILPIALLVVLFGIKIKK